MLVMFIVNQNRIVSNLKTTGFFDKVFGKTPTFVENAKIVGEDKVEENDVEPMSSVSISLTGEEESVETTSAEAPKQTASVTPINQKASEMTGISLEKSSPKTEEAVQSSPVENTVNQEVTSSSVEKADNTVASVVESKTETAKNNVNSVPKPASSTVPNTTQTKSSAAQPVQPAKTQQPKAPSPVPTMNIKLCFMTIGSDGHVSTKEVTRSMKKSDSPLVDSINALINGPTSAEENSGCKSLVSNGTRLLGANVRNGVATLNFSGEFEFNQYGIEGSRGQLQQIVYTATAFPTVSSVQFLIDGEKKEYLGLEGVWIGSPLSRNSF